MGGGGGGIGMNRLSARVQNVTNHKNSWYVIPRVAGKFAEPYYAEWVISGHFRLETKGIETSHWF